MLVRVPGPEAIAAEALARRYAAFGLRNLGLRPASARSDVLAGYIFSCSAATFQECIDRCLMGSPPSAMRGLRRIEPGYTQVFLYHIDEKRMYGVFEATAPAATNIVPNAWTVPWGPEMAELPADKLPVMPLEAAQAAGRLTRFSAQLSVRVAVFFEDGVTRGEFLPAIGGADPRGRFPPELSLPQAVALLGIFAAKQAARG